MYAQSPIAVAATWSGAIEPPGGRLAIVVRLRTAPDGSWSGTIDIPQQGARAVPLTDVVVNPPAVSFRIPKAPGDPRPVLAKVRVPVLAVGGERDLQVAAAENLREIERTVRAGGNADVTTVLLPNLNHLLQTSASGLPNEDATIEETISPAALTLVTDWLLKRTAR